jgi:multiple sugar transport system permease protein
MTSAAAPRKHRSGANRSRAVGSGATEPMARRIGRAALGRQPIGMIFGAPYLLFIVALFAYPLGLAVYMSFHRYYFTAPGVSVPRPFVGLANYAAVLSDPAVRQSFLNVLIFLVINVPFTVMLSLLLATALNAAIPFRAFFRTSFLAPYVTASVAMIGVWLFMFSSGGIVNTALGSLAPVPSWLVNEHWAMPSIAIYVTWKGLGFYILLYLAALQSVPKELYEAAVMDGASWRHRFMSVTVPGVRQVTTLVTLLALITGANLFTEPYLLTGGGGPNGKSSSPVLQIYQTGIEQNHPDFAAALGIILVIGVLLIAGIQQLVQRRQA